MSRESELTQLWLKWVESELSQVGKFGFWVESELSQVSNFGIWVESELSHLDCHMSQSRVNPKKWVEHNPGDRSGQSKNVRLFGLVDIGEQDVYVSLKQRQRIGMDSVSDICKYHFLCFVIIM